MITIDNLIINADDFGRNMSTNRAIVDAFERNYITQTTLMVNMDACDDAIRLAHEHSLTSKIGLHFNLTEGPALSSKIKNTFYCDENGNFQGYANACKLSLFPSSYIREAIKDEATLQIEKYLSYNLPLLHCDSHHHIHTHAPVASIILPLLRKYGFRSVRRPYNMFLRFGPKSIHYRARNLIFAILRCGLESSRYFGATTTKLCSKQKITEYMVHPVYNKSGQLVDCIDYNEMSGELLIDAINRIKKWSK